MRVYLIIYTRKSAFVFSLGERSLQFPPQVLVNVLDVNDVTPTFPRAYEGPFEVTEGQPGPRVWTLKASDEDSGLNGKVEYSITGGDLQSQYLCLFSSGCLQPCRFLKSAFRPTHR